MAKNVWCFCFLVIWKYLKNTQVYRLSETDIWLIRKAVITIAHSYSGKTLLLPAANSDTVNFLSR